MPSGRVEPPQPTWNDRETLSKSHGRSPRSTRTYPPSIQVGLGHTIMLDLCTGSKPQHHFSMHSLLVSYQPTSTQLRNLSGGKEIIVKWKKTLLGEANARGGSQAPVTHLRLVAQLETEGGWEPQFMRVIPTEPPLPTSNTINTF
jgi:hypothetical protein